jgi:hypothetical protein
VEAILAKTDTQGAHVLQFGANMRAESPGWRHTAAHADGWRQVLPPSPPLPSLALRVPSRSAGRVTDGGGAERRHNTGARSFIRLNVLGQFEHLLTVI